MPRILVALDDSCGSEKALEAAVKLAQQDGGRLTAVTVLERTGNPALDRLTVDFKARAKNRLEELLQTAANYVFVFSCFVRCRKPDPEIYQMALDIVQVPAGTVVYVDAHAMFVEAARSLGIRSLQHLSYRVTRELLATFGLALEG